MGNNAQETVSEIEETREDLARKVDLLVGQAKVEAKEIGKKLAIAGVVLAGLLILGYVAKKRIEE